MHWRNSVSGQPALVEPHPSVNVISIMCLVFQWFLLPPLVDNGNGSSSNGLTGVTRYVWLGEVSTRWCDAHLISPLSPDL